MTAQRVVWWKSMSRTLFSVIGLSAVVTAAVVVGAAPSVTAAPTTDSQGFVDSTARCASPATAVIYGSTATSRVAICKAADGTYEYRGVRIRDGARLILPAKSAGNGTYTAENDGITYTVTASALTVSAGTKTLRQESMDDAHESTAATSTSGSSPPSTSASTSATPTSLPPPLPAEVGGTAQ
jgi:hypothetical protein